MSALHSKFSASAASRWMACPGSMVLQVGIPDKSSKYAEEGTMAHALAEDVLRNPEANAWNHTGTLFAYTDHGQPKHVMVGSDMAGHVDVYVDNVRQYANDATLMVEQKLNYANFIGLPKEAAWGTSDAVIIKGDEIQVHDLKYGQGDEVDPENNEQMQLYALGALDAFDGLAGDFKHVRMVIHQPRIVKAPKEWDCTVDELMGFAVKAKQAVHMVKAAEHGWQAIAEGTKTQAEWEAEYLNPGTKQCKWCRAQATCPKLRAEVSQTVADFVAATPEEFDNLIGTNTPDSAASEAWLAVCLSKAGLIEDWLNAVRAEVERRLLAGKSVPGYKLVKGKQGNRAWRDAEAAEALLKSFRLKIDEMYDMKVISPTSAEKVLAESPKRWAKAQELITRADGKPSVAPLSDKRPALEVKPVADEFEDLSIADELG